MNWVLWALIGAGLLHAVEEYLIPGGFLGAMRDAYPSLAYRATGVFATEINVAMILFFLAAAVVGSTVPAFSLAAPAVAFLNTGLHVGSSIRRRRYVAGTVTAMLLYVPLTVIAYASFGQAGLLSVETFLLAGTLAVLIHAVPIAAVVSEKARHERLIRARQK